VVLFGDEVSFFHQEFGVNFPESWSRMMGTGVILGLWLFSLGLMLSGDSTWVGTTIFALMTGIVMLTFFLPGYQLHTAARNGNIEIMKKLLDQGAAVDLSIPRA